MKMHLRNLSFLVLILILLQNVAWTKDTGKKQKSEYDRIIDYYYEQEIEKGQFTDYKHLKMLLWYAAKLEPQRIEAYDRLASLAFTHEMSNYKYRLMLAEKAYRIAKKTNHKDLEAFRYRYETLRKDVQNKLKKKDL